MALDKSIRHNKEHRGGVLTWQHARIRVDA